jgi:hypothetical protein
MMNGRKSEPAGLTAIAIFGLVVAELRVLNFDATFEFPSYITLALGEACLSFGTANGTWGWNDEHGNGGDLGVGPEGPVADVVEAIIELLEGMDN